MLWGPSGKRARCAAGFHSAEERALLSNRTLSPEMRRRKSEWMTAMESATGMNNFRRLSHKELARTPLPFRDLLLGIARTATVAAIGPLTGGRKR
jgi:hypothetical protein